jgi:hypothetical protein
MGGQKQQYGFSVFFFLPPVMRETTQTHTHNTIRSASIGGDFTVSKQSTIQTPVAWDPRQDKPVRTDN